MWRAVHAQDAGFIGAMLLERGDAPFVAGACALLCGGVAGAEEAGMHVMRLLAAGPPPVSAPGGVLAALCSALVREASAAPPLGFVRAACGTLRAFCELDGEPSRTRCEGMGVLGALGALLRAGGLAGALQGGGGGSGGAREWDAAVAALADLVSELASGGDREAAAAAAAAAGVWDSEAYVARAGALRRAGAVAGLLRVAGSALERAEAAAVDAARESLAGWPAPAAAPGGVVTPMGALLCALRALSHCLCGASEEELAAYGRSTLLALCCRALRLASLGAAVGERGALLGTGVCEWAAWALAAGVGGAGSAGAAERAAASVRAGALRPLLEGLTATSPPPPPQKATALATALLHLCATQGGGEAVGEEFLAEVALAGDAAALEPLLALLQRGGPREHIFSLLRRALSRTHVGVTGHAIHTLEAALCWAVAHGAAAALRRGEGVALPLPVSAALDAAPPLLAAKLQALLKEAAAADGGGEEGASRVAAASGVAHAACAALNNALQVQSAAAAAQRPSLPGDQVATACMLPLAGALRRWGLCCGGEGVAQNACAALFSLALLGGEAGRAAGVDAIPALVDCLRSCAVGAYAPPATARAVQEQCVAALAHICSGGDPARRAMLLREGALPLLVAVVGRARRSGGARLAATGALAYFASPDPAPGDVAALLVAGAPKALLALLEECATQLEMPRAAEMGCA
jgi:hypothetical protein